MKHDGDITIGFFTELNEAFREETEQKPLSDRDQAKDLAWNACDLQDQALARLEYFMMSHHAYLAEAVEGWGDFSKELTGFYLTAMAILKDLKSSSETIQMAILKDLKSSSETIQAGLKNG